MGQVKGSGTECEPKTSNGTYKVHRDLVCTVMQELDDEGLNRRKPIA